MGPRPGSRNDLTDIAGLGVGVAHDEAARTGVTVVLCDKPTVAAVAVEGGGPGTRETDALAPEALVGEADAIVLSGGSVYGLEAASAVTSRLGAAGRGVRLRDDPAIPPAPIVPAAILYDLMNGGTKARGATPPYARLGLAALEDADRDEPVLLGAFGAGHGARAGAHPGGLGSASIILECGVTVAALIAVNAFGSPYMPGTRTPWAWPFEAGDEFSSLGAQACDPSLRAFGFPADAKLPGARGPANTTIGVVATDARLDRAEAKRFAKMATAGLARALRPVFAPMDGDVLFALSTGRKKTPEPRALGLAEIGDAGADCVARAVARGCLAAR